MLAQEPQMAESNFYAAAVRLIDEAGVPFRVGGAYALSKYTGIFRDTKDFDIFVRPADVERMLELFRKHHYRAEVTYGHWLAKVHHGEAFIDVIYRAGNGLCEVDESWFRPSEKVQLMGEQVWLVPAEEMIWQKAYIMERERFDGADVAHLIRARASQIDWKHLVLRFGDDWRVLMSHLLLFGYIYPSERHLVPAEILSAMLERARAELDAPQSQEKLCRGTLLSRAQYLPDVERWGYTDARTHHRCSISPSEIVAWTDAIGKERAWA